METIKIFGHKVPDTDSTCSAIAYAKLKNELGIKATAHVLGEINNETKFVLKHFNVETPELLEEVGEGEKVILVDHNEAKQSIEGREKCEILEVIDHHRVSDFHTTLPLYFRSEPVGCTCTIVAKMYMENKVEIKKDIAGILLSAILSDTLMYKSPISTEEDKKIGSMLEKIAEINHETYGREMIEAGSKFNVMTEKEILEIDAKTFEIEGIEIRIGQLIALDIGKIMERKDKLIIEMEKVCEENKYNLFVLVMTDIMKNGSEVIIVGKDKSIGEKSFSIPKNENSKFMDGVVSRKKQVVPLIYDSFK